MAKASSKKAIFAALIGNSLIAVTKFFAAAITGSSAMLSEGIHSLVDTGNQVLLLHGLNRARKPPDKRFPFGHGKEVYFWSFVVAILIFAVGAGVSMYEGVHRLHDPKTMTRPMVNYVVLTLAIAFEAAAFWYAYREFAKAKGDLGYFEAVRRGKDPSLFVVLFEDSAAILGLLVALVGVGLSHWTGDPMFDACSSILIGVILGLTAIWLAVETKGLLIGERADPRVVEAIRQLIMSHPKVNHVNELLTMHMGPDFVLLNVSVDFDDGATAPEVEAAIDRIDGDVKRRFPEVKRIFVELEARRRLGSVR